ncbi:HPP family protein [Halococcus dombrowskii]|uniref:HPP family protein n=1 Tax=Halococcus dombrowskii TaxID=179637 RepID=A0AAV3SJT7_HALDO|nr:HPP family protein [Halococcus dombrowskii]UOO96393.1 HPP family protein [Halococcus dombrowskii]
MREEVRAYCRAAVSRSRRFERREFHEFRRWLESTRNLVHLSVVLFVPLLVGLVTLVANATNLSFLLFPPLASGAYLLFAHPEERYSSPLRFVAGLTVGALCGWLAIELTGWLFYAGGPGSIHAPSAALAMLLTGAATWAFSIEEPAAFSTALLAVVDDAPGFSYVLSIAVSSLLVAGVFVLWHRRVYRHRARYLYQSTKGDDHVLVPMRGDHADATASFGARIAAAHDAGKVVLLDIVESPKDVATDGGTEREVSTATKTHASHLEACAERIEETMDVPCEVVVIERGAEAPATTALGAAREANCDLIVTPYERADGRTASFVTSLFRTDMDVIAHRSADGRTDWSRVLVSVRRASDVAHSMLDFACRLTGRAGKVSLCHCIDNEHERRDAESMLAELVETFAERIETRVAHGPIEEFLADASSRQNLLMLGASADRSAVSRLLSPATFQRLHDIECDVAIVDRRYRPLERE